MGGDDVEKEDGKSGLGLEAGKLKLEYSRREEAEQTKSLRFNEWKS